MTGLRESKAAGGRRSSRRDAFGDTLVRRNFFGSSAKTSAPMVGAGQTSSCQGHLCAGKVKSRPGNRTSRAGCCARESSDGLSAARGMRQRQAIAGMSEHLQFGAGNQRLYFGCVRCRGERTGIRNSSSVGTLMAPSRAVVSASASSPACANTVDAARRRTVQAASRIAPAAAYWDESAAPSFAPPTFVGRASR